jgi:arabinoxylan arabinofuranohydrolase
MCYMVSDNPMDPNSWVYKGVYGAHPGNGTNNNHSHLQKFKGTYYHIYHNAILRENMKAANAVDANLGIFRSLCVNKATVNESTATISKVKLDLTGPDVVGDGMNPYEGVQAETMATCGGVEYEDFTNIKKNGRINALGNDASENMQVRMKEGCWTYLRKVNFGSAGASKITLRAKGEGTIEMRFGRKGAKASATIDVSSDEMTDITVDVDPTVFTGTKNIFILVASGEVYLDAWQATAAQADAIKTIERQQTAAQRYDLSGRRLDNADHRGLLIEQYQDAQGNTHARKRVQ